MNTINIILPALLSAAAVTFSGAETIPVVNPSFEFARLNPCVFVGTPEGWEESVGTHGSWNAGLGDQCFPLNGFPNGVPDGVNNGYTNGPSSLLAQTLGYVLEANQTYTLRVMVGRRSDNFPMQQYSVRLLAGSTLLVEDLNQVDPPSGGWVETVLTFISGDTHPAVGEPLRIELKCVQGAQANFDDVRLEKGVSDCNGNGTPDFIDISSGFSDDEDGNGIPDECEEPPAVLGDLDHDGDVDGADFGLLLGAWGACADCANCPADLDEDCDVDGADFGLLLGSWT